MCCDQSDMLAVPPTSGMSTVCACAVHCEACVSLALAAPAAPLSATNPHTLSGSAKASELVGRASGAAEETSEWARHAAKGAVPDELFSRREGQLAGKHES